MISVVCGKRLARPNYLPLLPAIRVCRARQSQRCDAAQRQLYELRDVAPVVTMNAMQVIARPPTLFRLPGAVVPIATERWLMEPWDGENPPDLPRSWSRKPKYDVAGARSCAELAIADQLAHDGWGAVWVSAFWNELRTQWQPAAGFRTLADAGAPGWAAEIFDRLRAANGGRLGGFFDVFAWQEPGKVRFAEAKSPGDSIQPTQRRFLATALQFHDPAQFMIIEARPAGRRPLDPPVP